MEHHGYVYILNKEHPACDRDGYVLEHRIVMEKALSRLLNPNEVIHHKNGIRSDNREENLELHKSQASHMSEHYPKGSPFSKKKYLRDKKGRVIGVE